MTNKEYQEFVNICNLTAGNHNANIPQLLCGLTEEVGELSGLYKRFYRGDGPPDKEKVISELGDVLWYLTAIMSANNLTLDQVIIENKKKLSRRRANNTIKGSGDR
jgi:NTP pyrophosphatase (non-canonical NTP hydrolase)